MAYLKEVKGDVAAGIASDDMKAKDDVGLSDMKAKDDTAIESFKRSLPKGYVVTKHKYAGLVVATPDGYIDRLLSNQLRSVLGLPPLPGPSEEDEAAGVAYEEHPVKPVIEMPEGYRVVKRYGREYVLDKDGYRDDEMTEFYHDIKKRKAEEEVEEATAEDPWNF